MGNPQSTFLTDYFYGDESESFTYFRIPRLLITSPRFKGLSTEAKLLYGMMLDRMGLSRKNGWYDSDGRVFVYYTVKEISEDLCCGQEKAVKLAAELDSVKGVGLIDRKRQGQGKPTKIYVKRFTTGEAPARPEPGQTSEILNSRLPKIGSPDFGKTEFKSSDYPTSRIPVFGSPDFGKSECSYTEYSNPDISQTESVSPSIETFTEPSARARERDADGRTDGRTVRERIKKQIDYEFLPFRLDGWALRQADELLELMVEVALTQSPTIQIGRAAYPIDYVQERFARIGLDHIEAVLRGLKENEGRVTNVRAYLLASLFNSVATMDNATALSCTG